MPKNKQDLDLFAVDLRDTKLHQYKADPIINQSKVGISKER